MLLPLIKASLISLFQPMLNITASKYHITLDPGLEPYQCLYASMWIKRLGCLAGHQEVSRCRTKGESEESVAHRQQSKQGNPSCPVSETQARSPSPEVQNKKDLIIVNVLKFF